MRSNITMMGAIADPGRPLSLHYQPVKRLQDVSQPTTTFEAQIRYQSIAAVNWLPAILSSPSECRILDRWVMLNVADQMRRDDRCDRTHHRYMVNITSASLIDSWFADSVERTFRGVNGRGHRLIIEVLENRPITQAAIATLKRLDGICQVYMDDFGVEHSNLDTVRSAPLAGLKIDGSFASKMLNNPKNADVIRGVFCMCEAMRLACVVEWVESRAVLDAIAQLHQLTPRLDLWVQGFYVDAL